MNLRFSIVESPNADWGVLSTSGARQILTLNYVVAAPSLL